MEDTTYNELTFPEDSSDDHSLAALEDERQVSLSMRRLGALENHQKVLTVVLSVLTAVLLIVDIGLGVYYRNLTDRERIIKDIGVEVANLQKSSKTAVDTLMELKKQLANEGLQQQKTAAEWELDHQKTRNANYKKESEKLLAFIAGLKSHIPLLNEGCRHCLPGWNFIDSLCYYIPFSENIPRRSWEESREYCKNFGADLIEIRDLAKQKAISYLITTYHNPSIGYSASGFWIGARDVDVEGDWKWLDGTQVTEGFWSDGEPNNLGNEDCAAVYPYRYKSPTKSWNDAPCNHHLKWICEKAPH